MTCGRTWLGVLCALALSSLIGCGNEPTEPPPASETAPVGSMIPATEPLSDAQIAAAQEELAALGLAEVGFAPPAADGPVDARRLASEGPPARPIADSPLLVDRRTPAALLDGALAALEQQDVAALARLSRGSGTLTEDDAADAARRFLSPAGSRYWGRIGEAVKAGRMQVVEDDAGAVVTVDVGGAAGTYRVRMRREVDGWVLES